MWLRRGTCAGGLRVASTVLGGLILLENGWLAKLHRTMWKSDSNVMSESSRNFYDKYGRGLRYFLAGILLTVYGLLELAGSIGTAGLIADLL